MDNKYNYKITESIKYYFEIKANSQVISDGNKTSNTITPILNKICVDIEDDSYIDLYVNYNLLDTHIYKW